MPRATTRSLLLLVEGVTVDAYCAGPTAFLTASVVAAPPSATLPFVSSAASSMASIETGGASTYVRRNVDFLERLLDRFDQRRRRRRRELDLLTEQSHLGACVVKRRGDPWFASIGGLNSGKLRSDLFFHTASPCVRDMSLRLVRRASLTRNETRGPEGTVVSRRASRLVPGVC